MAAELRDPGDEAKEPYPIVRFTGQPIAAVAAISARAAEAALALIEVDYEALPHVTELADAMKPDSPPVFPGPTEQRATAGGGGAAKGLPQKATCAARAKAAHEARSSAASRKPTSSSKANTALKSRRTRRWSLMASSPIGAMTN